MGKHCGLENEQTESGSLCTTVSTYKLRKSLMFFMFRFSVLVGIRVRAVSQDVCPTVFRDDVFRVAVQGAEHPP